jgi:hypothetical protein
MAKVNLESTKQSKQIAELRNKLEKNGWSILNEVEKEFKGKPRWEIGDEVPNLIYSWHIQRNHEKEPLILQFIACFDYLTYHIETNECNCCSIQGTQIYLYFTKDKSLKNEKNRAQWKTELNEFIKQLSILE